MMTKINCMILGLSLVRCSIVAMEKSYWTLEQRLMVGRRLESMQPNMSRSRELQLWQHNNQLELEIERQRNMQRLELEEYRKYTRASARVSRMYWQLPGNW